MLTRALIVSCFSLVALAACGRNELEGSAFGCPEFQTVCDGVCSDMSRSDLHCGACGNPCGDSEECIASKCRPICDASATRCAVGCVDTKRDEAHCGGCNVECAPGATCSNGECQRAPCTAAQTLCAEQCVNTSTNREHCGECGLECPEQLLCNAGRCQVDCGENTQCGSECVDTSSDVGHCGNCITSCGADEACQEGQCLPLCPAGQTACGESCANLATDFWNCGACSVSCRAGQACNAGVCTGCIAGATLCGAACVNLDSDPAHCGLCNNVCNGHCVAGSCELECAAGLSECDGSCVDTESDPVNCGGCAQACQGTQPCADGYCVLECVGQTDYCQGRCVDFQIDPDNCGACAVECANGLSCRQGTCVEVVGSCNWTNAAFPFALNGDTSVGSITMADDCNVYVAVQRDDANSGGLVYALSSASQSASLIAEIPGLARGIAYRPEDDTLFVTARDRLMALNTDGSNLRELDSVAAQYLNGMALAPTNWAQLGGHLIVAQNTGDILAFDPEGGEGVVVVSLPAFISDVVFDGQQLYVAAHSASQVLRVNPGGVSSTFADLPCEPDGLAVEPGVRLFAACGREDAIYAVSLPTGTVSEVGSADLNPGWAPAGLFWNSGALMVIEETTGLNAIFP